MLDANGLSLHLGVATEGASVLGVLADFNFLHHFSERGTVTGPVFPYDPDLLCALSRVAGTEAQARSGKGVSYKPCSLLHIAAHFLSPLCLSGGFSFFPLDTREMTEFSMFAVLLRFLFRLYRAIPPRQATSSRAVSLSYVFLSLVPLLFFLLFLTPEHSNQLQ